MLTKKVLSDSVHYRYIFLGQECQTGHQEEEWINKIR
jgi:hypothetical protein